MAYAPRKALTLRQQILLRILQVLVSFLYRRQFFMSSVQSRLLKRRGPWFIFLRPYNAFECVFQRINKKQQRYINNATTMYHKHKTCYRLLYP